MRVAWRSVGSIPERVAREATREVDLLEGLRRIGIWATSYSVGAAVGPLAGEALLEVSWWGSVLLLAVPVMLLLLLVGPRLLPERDIADGISRLAGAVLSVRESQTNLAGCSRRYDLARWDRGWGVGCQWWRL
jgi:MFS family permease